MLSSDQGSSSRPVFINPNYFKHLRRSNKWGCTLCTDAKTKKKAMTYREAVQHERNSTDHSRLVSAQSFQSEQPQSFAWGEQSQPLAWGQPSAWEAQGPSVEAWFAPLIEEENTLVTKEQLRGKEHQYFSDQVEDMVPFWIRGIEAAERGEVLRLEEFLDSLEHQSWPPRGRDYWAHDDRHSHYGGRAFDWEPADDVKKWSGTVSSVSADSGRRTGQSVSGILQASSYDPRKSKFGSAALNSRSLVEVVARQSAVDENRKKDMYSFIELSTNEKVKRIDDLIRTLRLT
ncbi:hypothetical protein BDP27DRAFT_1398409 [Rhodocollybia butyracea]|uniref:Uncharacterized protein n=1 Tax=Rhodocollybia butyracea TaxID=206335 RepID=A0A9P5UEE0_9AGAR|nr:hypothetical protein BDP27DRAFT_1398409 [Rhodocollybia butyracea]